MKSMNIQDFQKAQSEFIGKQVTLHGFLIAIRAEKRFWHFKSIPERFFSKDHVRIVIPNRDSPIGKALRKIPEYCDMPFLDDYQYRFINKVIISGVVIEDDETREIAVEMESIQFIFDHFTAFVKAGIELDDYKMSLDSCYQIDDYPEGYSSGQEIRLSGYLIGPTNDDDNIYLAGKQLIDEIYDRGALSDQALQERAMLIQFPDLLPTLNSFLGQLIGVPYGFIDEVHIVGRLNASQLPSKSPLIVIQEISEIALGRRNVIFHVDFSDHGVIHIK